MKRLVLIVAALLAFTGAAQNAPVRHLEYAFAVYPTAMPSHGYYNGVLSVDILGTASDGGTQIRTTESFYQEPRPEQSRLCEVFANGDVHCDDVPPYPSDSEFVLYPLLANTFFSAASSTAAASWRQKFAYSFSKGLHVFNGSLDLSSTPRNDGTLLVASKGVLIETGGLYRKISDRGSIVYDVAAAVPIVVHAVRTPIPANGTFSETAIDLQLMKDSNPASAAAMRQLAPPRFTLPP